MIEPFAFVILVFAAFRLTTLVVTDTILDRPRAWLHRQFPVSETYTEEKPKRGKYRYINASESKWWIDKGTFIGDLTSCAFCAGVWISGILGAVWYYAPWSHIFISLIAVAGAQLLLSQWSAK